MIITLLVIVIVLWAIGGFFALRFIDNFWHALGVFFVWPLYGLVCIGAWLYEVVFRLLTEMREIREDRMM